MLVICPGNDLGKRFFTTVLVKRNKWEFTIKRKKGINLTIFMVILYSKKMKITIKITPKKGYCKDE